MKTKFFTFLALSAFTFVACSDDNNGPETEDRVVLTELNGNITAKDAVVEGSQVRLTGVTIVREGSTLTIPAGTTISARAGAGTDAYLLVERGAKIIAKGTADAPIVFTSETKSPGSWGGVIINGYAPISHALEAATEINTNILFGGTNASDNSGILDYVQIEYSGAKIDGDAEHNGLTLNGVGNGTQITNIVIKEGADDAIEFFGGSVNVTNLLAINAQDDLFDFSQGYTGTLTNAYGIWEEDYASSSDDPRGIEADGNLDGDNPGADRESDFTIKDMTIINKSTVASATMADIVKIRRGATATISNLLLVVGEGAKFGDIIDFTDGKGNGKAESTIAYTFNPEALFDASKVKGEGATITKNTTSTGANTSAFGWTGYSF